MNDRRRLLERAPSMWDPNIGMGTVTHQTIGYLWPMGPWYWVMERLGVPDWVAQRLWLATVMLAAGAGVVFLLRTLGWAGPGIWVAALSYELSPYVLHYNARLSTLLLAWAALPWLLGGAQPVRADLAGDHDHLHGSRCTCRPLVVDAYGKAAISVLGSPAGSIDRESMSSSAATPSSAATLTSAG